MDWRIGLSRQTEKFIARRRLHDGALLEPLARAIKKLDGADVSVDLKRLSGKWAGHFRIRTGTYRIIFSANFEERSILVEVFDNRDRAYR